MSVDGDPVAGGGALTPFWICGGCGFFNHPRMPPAGVTSIDYSSKCEQCGGAQANEFSVDYNPGAPRG